MIGEQDVPIRRGPRPGEITLAQVGRIWGLGRTRTWELVVAQGVIPHRHDRYQHYVKEEDAIAYLPTLNTIRRGKQPKGE